MRALEALSQQPAQPGHANHSQSLKAIDDVIGADRRPAGRRQRSCVRRAQPVVILIAARLFIGINQIKALKSEVTVLERQLALKKQTASMDQQDKKNVAEQKTEREDQFQNQSLVPGATEKGKNPVDNRAAASALALSPDEVRLIREYIKPAPFTGGAAPPINVGDPVATTTIPLASPLTDKIPKLLGGRFTIRNGAILILKRDSHQADAVLAPN